MSDLPELSTVQLPDSLVALVSQAEALARASFADGTWRAYRSAWSMFERWTQRHQVAALPAHPAIVVLYATDLATRCAPATVSLHMSAISATHRRNGYDSPIHAGPVRQVMRGIRRTYGTAPKNAKAALRLAHLQKMSLKLPSTLGGVRDRAILTLGWWGAFRRSELAALNVEDVDERPEGLVVTIIRGKRDQERKGRTVAVPSAGDLAVCSVRAVRAWLLLSELTEGPLFRGVNRWGTLGGRISGRAVNRVVKYRAELANLDSTLYGAHSLRSGFCTEAAMAGVDERVIAKQTGHTTVEGVRTYIREADHFADNAAASIINKLSTTEDG